MALSDSDRHRLELWAEGELHDEFAKRYVEHRLNTDAEWQQALADYDRLTADLLADVSFEDPSIEGAGADSSAVEGEWGAEPLGAERRADAIVDRIQFSRPPSWASRARRQESSDACGPVVKPSAPEGNAQQLRRRSMIGTRRSILLRWAAVWLVSATLVGYSLRRDPYGGTGVTDVAGVEAARGAPAEGIAYAASPLNAPDGAPSPAEFVWVLDAEAFARRSAASRRRTHPQSVALASRRGQPVRLYGYTSLASASRPAASLGAGAAIHSLPEVEAVVVLASDARRRAWQHRRLYLVAGPTISQDAGSPSSGSPSSGSPSSGSPSSGSPSGARFHDFIEISQVLSWTAKREPPARGLQSIAPPTSDRDVLGHYYLYVNTEWVDDERPVVPDSRPWFRTFEPAPSAEWNLPLERQSTLY